MFQPIKVLLLTFVLLSTQSTFAQDVSSQVSLELGKIALLETAKIENRLIKLAGLLSPHFLKLFLTQA